MDGVTATRMTRGSADRPWPAAPWLLLAGLAIFGPAALAQDSQTPPPETTESTPPPADSQASPGVQAPGQSPLVEEPEQVGPSQPAPITAVWKERRLSFSYSSDTTVYTCDALQGRVASVLRAVGARDDVKVRLSGCNDARVVHDPYASTPAGSRMDPMAPASERYRYRGAVTNTRQSVGVFVTAMLPTEVTDDVRAELEKDKSRRELVARATGNPAARFNDPVPFTAGWRQVTLSHQTVGFEPEECELVDQLTSVILPKIDVRTRSRSSSLCTANSVLAPQLVVEALMPVPYGGGGGLPRLKDEGANGEHDDDKGDDGKNDDGDPPAQ